MYIMAQAKSTTQIFFFFGGGEVVFTLKKKGFKFLYFPPQIPFVFWQLQELLFFPFFYTKFFSP